MGFLLGFLFVSFPPFYLNTVTLSFGGYSFKSSLNYFPKASYLEEEENDRFGKYVLFPWRKQKWNIFLFFTGKQHIFTCPDMLLGLHVPIVHCLVCCLATPFIYRLAELPFAQYDVCFIWINSQKSLGDNIRAYTLSTRQCLTRKFRYTSVLLTQSSSAFQFSRQLQSSEFSAFFMKVNGEVFLYLIESKFKSYFIQIIF